MIRECISVRVRATMALRSHSPELDTCSVSSAGSANEHSALVRGRVRPPAFVISDRANVAAAEGAVRAPRCVQPPPAFACALPIGLMHIRIMIRRPPRARRPPRPTGRSRTVLGRRAAGPRASARDQRVRAWRGAARRSAALASAMAAHSAYAFPVCSRARATSGPCAGADARRRAPAAEAPPPRRRTWLARVILIVCFGAFVCE